MKKLAAGLTLAVLLAAIPAAAQTKPENILTPRMRIYEPKYLHRQRAEIVGNFVHSVIESVGVYWEAAVNGLILRTQGPPEELDKAEALIRRFDVPDPGGPSERQIDMTVSLIRAFTVANSVQGSVPPELAPVVKEMKGALPYAGFSLADTIHVNVRDGLRVEDALPESASGHRIPVFYNLMFDGTQVSSDGKTVNIGSFHFGIKIPVTTATATTYHDEGITTPLTIYPGQKQVLGKLKIGATRSGPNSNNDDDLFVVLSCTVK